MSQYIRSNEGCGAIANLPPTIGTPQRVQSVWPPASSVATPRPIFPKYPMAPRYPKYPKAGSQAKIPGPWLSGLFGLGTEGESGTASNAWVVPVGIGLALGGLYMMFAKRRGHGGIFSNPQTTPLTIRISPTGWLVPGDGYGEDAPAYGMVRLTSNNKYLALAAPDEEDIGSKAKHVAFGSINDAADYVLKHGHPSKTIGEVLNKIKHVR